jgi:hypothetical protein
MPFAHFQAHFEQTPMGIHDQRERLQSHPLTLFCGGFHHHTDLQQYPFAAPSGHSLGTRIPSGACISQGKLNSVAVGFSETLFTGKPQEQQRKVISASKGKSDLSIKTLHRQ